VLENCFETSAWGKKGVTKNNHQIFAESAHIGLGLHMSDARPGTSLALNRTALLG